MDFFGSLLDPIVHLFQTGINVLYKMLSDAGFPNYGVAIILLTIIIKMALYPLTVKQIKSMKGLQELQPKMKKLQDEYKNNPQLVPGNPVIDSLAISKAILPEASSHKLGILANMFKRRDEISMNIESDKMHRAVYDCLMLMEVFVALLRRRFKEKDWEMACIMKNMEKYKGIAQFINK